MSNRQADDRHEELESKKIAKLLGLTMEELNQLSWDIDTNESSDDLIYEYILRFSDDCPEEILRKIDALTAQNELVIPAPEFQ